MPDFTPYRIARREQLTPTIISFTLQPETGQLIEYQPGQFVMVGVYDKAGQIIAKKPYSICSTPTNKHELQLSYKIQGEFTHRLAELRENDRVAIAGPFGVFTLRPQTTRDVVLLAGGIGLTPLLGMLRYAADNNITQNFTLLYAVRSPEELAFKTELDILAQQHPNIKCVYFAESFSDDWSGERGRITPELLKIYSDPMAAKEYYICGPPIFIQIMIKLLADGGVPAQQVHNEKF
ncbi:MAG: ferredoxin--NADP reductase [Patescibacteria group bacterium]|jgi:ferredoxin-NADP reductase